MEGGGQPDGFGDEVRATWGVVRVAIRIERVDETEDDAVLFGRTHRVEGREHSLTVAGVVVTHHALPSLRRC